MMLDKLVNKLTKICEKGDTGGSKSDVDTGTVKSIVGVGDGPPRPRLGGFSRRCFGCRSEDHLFRECPNRGGPSSRDGKSN